LDVRSIKLAQSQPRPWPGRDFEVQLRPLTHSKLQAAELVSQAYPPGGPREMTRKALVLEQAMSEELDAEQLLELTTPAELTRLYQEWETVQAGSMPDVKRLKAWLEKGIHDISEVLFDAVAAYNSESPAGYYGKPTSELTVGQLAYFLLLQSTYAKYFVPDEKGNTTQVSKRWLERDKKERHQWQISAP